MVSIVADNREIERCLEKIIVLAKNNGAEFSEGLVVNCLDGQMKIEAPPETAGQVVTRLPWDTLIPLPPFRLSIVDDDIVVSSREEGLTSTSVALMDAMLELYNLTGKIAEHRRRSPCLLVAAHPRLLDYLAQRHGRANPLMELLQSCRDHEIVLQTFLNTRAFSFYEGNEQYPPLPVLMPVIDLFNHHFAGAGYREDGRQAENRWLSIQRSAPLLGLGNESFACYGPYDAFDMWINYSFIDGRVPFVRSVEMTIDLPGLGTIELGNFFRRRAPQGVPQSVKDIAYYIPMVLRRRGNRVHVASLLIPGQHAAGALRRTLQFLIMEISPVHPKQRDLVLRAEAQILAANETYYRNLLTCLRSLAPDKPAQKGVVGDFIRVCEIQLARLQVYRGCAEG